MSGEKSERGSWKIWKTSRMSIETFVKEYDIRLSNGIGYITGPVSGNLAVLDFDLGGEAFEDWKSQVCSTTSGAALFVQLVIEKSQSGGYHIPVQLPEEYSVKDEALARRPQTDAEKLEYEKTLAEWKAGEEKGCKPKSHTTLIEVLYGAFCVCPPSPGYELIQGNLENIPTITVDEWELITTAACQLDKWPIHIETDDFRKQNQEPSHGWELRPGDDYNEQEDAKEKTIQLLIEDGWTENGTGFDSRDKSNSIPLQHFTGPHKSEGVSASVYPNGALHVFTSSVLPFDMGRTYSPFVVYATLKHYDGKNIDYKAASSVLHEKGYGKKSKAGRPKIPVDQLAQDFLKEKYASVDSDVPGLRFYRGSWYQYRNRGGWREIKFDDLKAYITAFLQSQGQTTSTNLVNNIIRSLDSTSVCTLPSDRYKMPCWIQSATSAEGMLPVKNGVLDVELVARALTDELGIMNPAGALHPHSRDLFITYGLDYAFDPAVTCPKFEKYLKEVQPKEENRRILQMLAGLLLVPECRYNVAFILKGEAGTGKSVFLETVQAMLGTENCCSIPYSNLGDRFNLAPLTTCLANIVDEMGTTTERGNLRAIEEKFKKITSGSTLEVEQKGIDAWSAPVQARMLFSTNTLPHFSDRSNGVWERLRIILFEQVIRGTKRQNNNLKAELHEELPGILNWALRGLAKLRENVQFPESQDGKRMKEEMRLSCDHERAFLNEATQKGGSVASEELYREYKPWVIHNRFHPVSNPKFQAAVKAVYPGAEKYRHGSGYDKGPVTWFGLSFRSDYQKIAIREF
jgi:P4 family phage/plasmid primase-like protien